MSRIDIVDRQVLARGGIRRCPFFRIRPIVFVGPRERATAGLSFLPAGGQKAGDAGFQPLYRFKKADDALRAFRKFAAICFRALHFARQCVRMTSAALGGSRRAHLEVGIAGASATGGWRMTPQPSANGRRDDDGGIKGSPPPPRTRATLLHWHAPRSRHQIEPDDSSGLDPPPPRQAEYRHGSAPGHAPALQLADAAAESSTSAAFC